MFKYILKRNDQKVPFHPEKITNAIFRASSAVGESDWKRSQELSEQVVLQLSKRRSKSLPTVEEVQDVVEKVLIDNGLAKVAKAYILYRKHRSEIRQEKAQLLNKEQTDQVDKKFDVNALRVLVARYLRKDDRGKVIESPKELFKRVAVHGTLPSLLYDKRVFKKTRKPKEDWASEEFDSIKQEGKISIGEYPLNRHHLSAFKRTYDRFACEGQMKMTWKGVLRLFKNGYFDKYEDEIREYYTIMVERKFMPNTPAIANFGNVLGMGSACFVLGIDDDIEDIMSKLKAAAIIFKSGGGVGYNFSHLRPEGDYVKSTGGVASGPVSFMTMYDNMTEVIKQGGIRRGANMGILNSNHPDIIKFIHAKEGNKALRNFNISVFLMDDFWKYYESKEPYPLLNPRTGEVVNHVDPQQLFDLIAHQAWESAEPGVIFGDRVNEFNPFLEALGPIETTNPCGEVLLYPYESCNLGSLNVWAFVDKPNGGKPKVNWKELGRVAQVATRFLDNVVDVNRYPLQEIEDMTLLTRKLGLGVMGVGDTLFELSLPYNSKRGLNFMEKLMELVNYHSKVESLDLAKERGPMPMFKQSFYAKGKLPFAGFKDKSSWNFDWAALARDIKKYGIRNGYTTVIAPTGSISMIAGTSSGIEPVYSLVFEKNVSVGSFYYVDPVFEDRMQKEGLMDDELIRDVSAHNGSVANLSYIPEDIKKAFVTAYDIAPKEHIRALAAFQKWTDSSISKTNNFPANATTEHVKEAYLLAHKLGCKDVTVFRDGSITDQVLVTVKDKKKKSSKDDDGNLVSLKDEKAKGLAVYKEASVSNDADLEITPVSESLVHEPDSEEKDDDLELGGPVHCKLCNL